MEPEPAAMATTPEQEILEKLQALSLEGEEEVLVPFTKKDADIWKDFTEYRNIRRKWDSVREEEWSKHHPPYIRALFNNWPSVLETPRLRLRLLRETDAENAFRVLCNPTTMKYYGTSAHRDIEYTRKNYIDLMISRFLLLSHSRKTTSISAMSMLSNSTGSSSSSKLRTSSIQIIGARALLLKRWDD